MRCVICGLTQHSNGYTSRHTESLISTTTLPSSHLADTLMDILSAWAKEKLQHHLISYLVRSSTIKSGVVPDAMIWSRVCEVHTASVRAPAACPARSPDGASSTTRPAVWRGWLSRASFYNTVLLGTPLCHTARTILWVCPDALSPSEVRIWLRLAALDVVGSHITRGGQRYACPRECLWGVDLRGWIVFESKKKVEMLANASVRFKEGGGGDVPEVTMVHPRADGELPASICSSSAFAPGSAIGPPSMTASSKRTIASYVSIPPRANKNHDPTIRKGYEEEERKGCTAICSGVSNLHNSPSVSVSRRPCPLCAAASASKPYSFPKRSQAARTPGVESTSVLEERGGGGLGN